MVSNTEPVSRGTSHQHLVNAYHTSHYQPCHWLSPSTASLSEPRLALPGHRNPHPHSTKPRSYHSAYHQVIGECGARNLNTARHPDIVIFPRIFAGEREIGMQRTRKLKTGPRIRSFGGCLTCRTRKVKCDETHPICRQCQRSRLVCGGYEAKIRFVHFSPDGTGPQSDVKQNDDGHSRRILFTGMYG